MTIASRKELKFKVIGQGQCVCYTSIFCGMLSIGRRVLETLGSVARDDWQWA